VAVVEETKQAEAERRALMVLIAETKTHEVIHRTRAMEV